MFQRGPPQTCRCPEAGDKPRGLSLSGVGREHSQGIKASGGRAGSQLSLDLVCSHGTTKLPSTVNKTLSCVGARYTHISYWNWHVMLENLGGGEQAPTDLELPKKVMWAEG